MSHIESPSIRESGTNLQKHVTVSSTSKAAWAALKLECVCRDTGRPEEVVAVDAELVEVEECRNERVANGKE